MHSNISKIKQLRLFPFLKLVGGGSMSQLYILEHLNAFLLNKLIKIHDCDMRNMAVSLDIVTVTFVYFVITRGPLGLPNNIPLLVVTFFWASPSYLSLS